MSMLPIFALGLIVGIIVSNVWRIYEENTPSEVKLRLQEAELIRYKSDIEALEKTNSKLYEEIAELKNELKK